LQRILESNPLKTKRQEQKILAFLVEEAIAGRSVKSSVLAASLNINTDSAARREVGRLRIDLPNYYATEKDPDPLRIEFPAEGYGLTFSSLDLPLQDDANGAGLETPLAKPTERTGNGLLGVNQAVMVGLPPSAGPSRRRRQFAAIMAAIASFAGAGFLVWSSLRPPPLPSNRLVIGLAKLSPRNPAAEILRNRIQHALEGEQHSGPRIQVRLLSDELNAAWGDLQKQAKDISGDRVHVVLGASELDQRSYLPRMAVVQPFHSLISNATFADTVEALRIRINIDDREPEDPATAASISDLARIIYSFQYFDSRDCAGLENSLDGLHDKTLGSLILARCLYEVANIGTRAEIFARLKRGISMLNSLIGPSAEQACALDSSDDRVRTCYAVFLRGLFVRTAASSVGPVDSPAYVGRSLLDLRYAESFFRAKEDPLRIWDILQNRAELYDILGNLSAGSENVNWHLKAKDIEEHLLVEISRNDPDDPFREVKLRLDIAHVLTDLAWIQDEHRKERALQAMAEARLSLNDCAEDDAPRQRIEKYRQFSPKASQSLAGSTLPCESGVLGGGQTRAANGFVDFEHHNR
jgi:hypothetical protein